MTNYILGHPYQTKFLWRGMLRVCI